MWCVGGRNLGVFEISNAAASPSKNLTMDLWFDWHDEIAQLSFVDDEGKYLNESSCS
jgi:hypothetical protein